MAKRRLSDYIVVRTETLFGKTKNEFTTIKKALDFMNICLINKISFQVEYINSHRGNLQDG